MITYINWCIIFQICLSSFFGLVMALWCSVTLGFPLMAVEQVEIKSFSCRSQDRHACNFISSSLVLSAVYCVGSNSFSPRNSHEKHFKATFTKMKLQTLFGFLVLAFLTDLKQLLAKTCTLDPWYCPVKCNVAAIFIA